LDSVLECQCCGDEAAIPKAQVAIDPRADCRKDRFLASVLATVFGDLRSDLFARNLELARVDLPSSFVSSLDHHRIACGLRETVIPA
jgi:hypothetical protein